MFVQIICRYCGNVIGATKYRTDGVDVFHDDCPTVKPMGNDFGPGAVAINLTNPIGMEIIMRSITDPSVCSGSNVISIKLPFCTAQEQ